MEINLRLPQVQEDGNSRNDRVPPPASGQRFPSPVFERIYNEYLAMRSQFRDLASDQTRWRAIVHTDHGHGRISRIQYRGTIREADGRVHMPYDFETIHGDGEDEEEPPRTAREQNGGEVSGTRRDAYGGIILREVVLWENNKLWHNLASGKSDMAVIA